jgi:Ser/Thr protein kinase RdoA (MazF antagonist)
VLAQLRPRLAAPLIHRIDDCVRDGRDLWFNNHQQDRRCGWIHADLRPECVLLGKPGVAFLGFEGIGWGCCAYDLASLLFAWVERADYPALREALLRGYADRAKELLPSLEALVSFQALRGACVLARASGPWPGARRPRSGTPHELDAIVRRLARVAEQCGARGERELP